MLELKGKLALLIVDMQNGFVHPSGTFGKMGLDVSNHAVIIPSIQALRTVFRDKSMPVIYLRLGFAPDYADAGLIGATVPAVRDLQGFIRGTWDAEIVEALQPAPETDAEFVVDKTRNTGFWRTELADRLSALGVEQVLVTGVGTNVCVESTVRDAFTNGFYAVVLSDATATLTAEEHAASLKSMRWFAEVATVAEVKEALGVSVTSGI